DGEGVAFREPAFPLLVLDFVDEVIELAFEAIGLVVPGDFQIEEAAIAVEFLGVILGVRVVSQELPIGGMAAGAADLGEELFAGLDVGRDLAAGRGRMVEEIPFGDVEIAFGDFLAVAVAVGIVEADAGQAGLGPSADAAGVLAGGADKLLAAGVGDEGVGVALGAGVGGRVMGLQAGVDVEWR